MQGAVYGIETEESKIDNRLMTIFNYDEIFGTIINRFVVQSTIGHPLTVYGKGEQTRGFINIKDTMQCIYHSAKTPAKKGELRIFNQITETFSVNQLANLIATVGNDRGHNVRIKKVENPRIEIEEHYYNPIYQGLTDIGLKPNYLTSDVIHKFFLIVEKYKDNIDEDIIVKGIMWN